jgi:uncharacterized protein with PQ loop repeat
MDIVIHHHVIDRIAFFNGLISGFALYPQVAVVLVGGSISGISLTTFLIILLNSIVWLLYAIHRNLISLGVASLLNGFASLLLLIAIIAFH